MQMTDIEVMAWNHAFTVIDERQAERMRRERICPHCQKAKVFEDDYGNRVCQACKRQISVAKRDDVIEFAGMTFRGNDRQTALAVFREFCQEKGDPRLYESFLRQLGGP